MFHFFCSIYDSTTVIQFYHFKCFARSSQHIFSLKRDDIMTFELKSQTVISIESIDTKKEVSREKKIPFLLRFSAFNR